MKKILLSILAVSTLLALNSCMSLAGIQASYTAQGVHKDVAHDATFTVGAYTSGKNAGPADMYSKGNDRTTITYTTPKGMHWVAIGVDISNPGSEFDADLNGITVTTNAGNTSVPSRSRMMLFDASGKNPIASSLSGATQANPSTAKTRVPFLVTIPTGKRTVAMCYYLINDGEIPAQMSLLGTNCDMTVVPKPVN